MKNFLTSGLLVLGAFFLGTLAVSETLGVDVFDLFENWFVSGQNFIGL